MTSNSPQPGNLSPSPTPKVGAGARAWPIGDLARTVATTITALTEGHDMAADELYEGFDNSAYDAEARQRWGDAPVDRGNAAWERLGPAGQSAHRREAAQIGAGLAFAMAEGVPPDDDRVQSLVARHFAQIVAFWTPTAAAYAGLGQMYVDDERFTATYDAFAPGLAVYLRDAMARYAESTLRLGWPFAPARVSRALRSARPRSRRAPPPRAD